MSVFHSPHSHPFALSTKPNESLVHVIALVHLIGELQDVDQISLELEKLEEERTDKQRELDDKVHLTLCCLYTVMIG